MYNDRLDPDDQISAEEAIASSVAFAEEHLPEGLSELALQTLSQHLLHQVLSVFRPDLLA